MNRLKFHIKEFLKIQHKKSKRTYQSYVEGVDPLENLLTNYGDRSSNSWNSDNSLGNISSGEIDYLLGYFVIRKYMCNKSFNLNVARAVKGFFIYLNARGLYNTNDTKEMVAITNHYAREYPRINKLSDTLWDYVEKDTDKLMAIKNKKKYQERLDILKEDAKKYTIKEVGYVEITKIDGNKVFGKTDEDIIFGPVMLDQKSASLVRVGDNINMISLRKKKEDIAWEICELGYVYPKAYSPGNPIFS